jgi:hypothetical protein
LYRTYLQQSHVFVGIYWQSYGWVAPEESVSGLKDEYLLSSWLPRLPYVKEPASDRQERLTALLRRVQDDDSATYKRFTTTEQLRQLLADDLVVLSTESFESARSPAPTAPATSFRVMPPPQPVTPLVGRAADIASDQITHRRCAVG